MCTVTESYNIYIYIFYVHTTFLFFIFYSFLLSFSFFRVPLLTASPSLLSSSIDPQTLLSSLETYCWSAQAQLPQTHRCWPTFGLSSLFSAFWLCVLSCACVLALCFRLCLCFGFVFRAGFLFRAVIFLLFFFFFTSFDGHGGVVVVQWFLWVWWWLWL